MHIKFKIFRIFCNIEKTIQSMTSPRKWRLCPVEKVHEIRMYRHIDSKGTVGHRNLQMVPLEPEKGILSKYDISF